ncbi:MAG: WecB/TagA/CpsF family glycosyltransferase [Devosia sp.]|uniref:WecB/TagA/CpsF family glycosyltransferase n=1 Tax=Devosia sp. TaxID=1871048 RepID=UPI001AD3B35B|nr:WecB/TagA/CpsF family glycosyltransferase [Devosia sp.]MBN9317457.1 WecB/TagA/CpsF family glycosyltransferase [Devosia sp.]
MTVDLGKRSVLGVEVNVIDYEAAVARILEAASSGGALSVSALAVHGVMTGALDITHKYRLNRLDIVAPDGQPVRWALRLLHGERLLDRVYGPALTRRVCAAAARRGLPIYLFGSKLEVLEAWKSKLAIELPDLVVAGYEPSRFRQMSDQEASDLDARVVASGARIVFVGLGCPRQEVFAYEHAKALSMPVIAVGAAFNFEAGTKEAPDWMQRAGLEWLFRLALEPRRLWRRYLLLNPLYCLLISAQKLGLLKAWFEREQAPSRPLRFG